MILVFILSIFLFIIVSVVILNILSTIRISVQNLEITNLEKNNITIKENSKVNKQFKITFSLYLFNKIKWISVKLNNNRMKKIYSSKIIEKIDFKKFEKNFKLKDLKILKRLEPKISLLKMKLKLGTEDAVLTSFTVFFISAIISLILPHVIKKYDEDRYKYIVEPIYMGKNLYKLNLDSIIELKMVHIINIIYTSAKKKKGDKKNEQSSNRRSYDYSYE